jgi:glycosyltransferase involved in cell wall biosynthesis
MAETTFTWSQIETPGASARLAAGGHLVRGWVWPKHGGVLCDVRARLGSRVFAGVHGIPRADVAAHFATAQSVPLAGFEVLVTLEPGDTTITLEVLEIDGRWSIFDSVEITVDTALVRSALAPSVPPLRWLDYTRLAENVLRRANETRSRDWPALARAAVASLPRPHFTRATTPPFIGFIDEPVTLSCCRYGRIGVFGHLFHIEQKIVRVLASVDLQLLHPLAYGLASPGPAAFYTQHANATDSGFGGLVDVPSQLPNPVTLRLYAELADGTLHLTHAVRTQLHSSEEEKPPLSASAAEFSALTTALNAELARADWSVQRDGEFAAALSRLGERVSSQPIVHAPATRVSASLSSNASVAIPRSALLATHSLAPHGAPRFLLDLARALRRVGTAIHVVSAEEGPLRTEFEGAGARVTVVSLSTAFASGDFGSALSAVDWRAPEITVANTFTCFWAVHAARAVGRPTLLYIHESTTPAEFYGSRVPPAIVVLAEESIAEATAVSFTSAATARYHGGRQHLTRGWIDVGGLDAWRARQSREDSRARLGVAPNEKLVCNIGTVSDRKGQHLFVRAVDLLWRRYPDLAANAKFVLLGGRDTEFDHQLAQTLRALGRQNLFVHGETTDYLDYYHAADVFACSSYEESTPRVVLEAMAMQAPIVASAVHGIPELVRPDLEALLVPAGDTAAWCEALAKLLASPEIGRDLALRARARVVAEFEAGAMLPRHLALIARVAACAARVT